MLCTDRCYKTLNNTFAKCLIFMLNCNNDHTASPKLTFTLFLPTLRKACKGAHCHSEDDFIIITIILTFFMPRTASVLQEHTAPLHPKSHLSTKQVQLLKYFPLLNIGCRACSSWRGEEDCPLFTEEKRRKSPSLSLSPESICLKDRDKRQCFY